MASRTPKEVAAAMARLIPQIVRGVSADFFVRREVTQTQFLALLTVQAIGPCAMGRLSSQMKIRMPTATGIVDRLVRDGFVRRTPCPEDRRQVTVELTAKGKSFIRQFQNLIRRRWEDVLRMLRPAELEAFFQVVTKLRERMESPSSP